MEQEKPVFEQALAKVLGVEGGFSDIEQDRGGKTNWGVTEGLARAHGYEGDMRALPLLLAQDIYWSEFWAHKRLRLDLLAAVSPRAAAEVFEQAVNTGVRGTAKRVQRVLNVLNRDEALYYDLKVDGWALVAARSAVTILIDAGDEEYLLQWLNVAQGAHYLALCEADPSQETFARGWVDKRVQV